MHVLAADAAVAADIALIATFGGIGVLVNGLIVYVVVLIHGERRENQESRQRRSGKLLRRKPTS